MTERSPGRTAAQVAGVRRPRGGTTAGAGADGLEGLAGLREASRDGESIFESRTFLFLCFLGLSPLVLASLPNSRLVIDALSIWAGLCWGGLLFRLFAPPALSLRVAALVLLGTSFLVMPLFELFLLKLPAQFVSKNDSGNLLEEWLGFVFNVGLREEAFKALPVLVALWLVPKLRQPRSGVVLGMMAGIGFASTENVYYVYSTLSDAIERTTDKDMSALLMPIYNNMVRTMVGPFAHATFSGLFGSFAAAAAARGAPLRLLEGLFLAALLHGTYNTAVGVSAPLGAATLSVSLFLAMATHRGIKDKDPLPSTGEGLFSRTVVRHPGAAISQASSATGELASAVTGWFVATPDGVEAPVPMSGVLRIGRDSTACSLVLTDPAVSRVHAVVELSNGRPFITRESRGGTVLLNGAPVDTAELRPGDEIHVGNSLLLIIWRAE